MIRYRDYEYEIEQMKKRGRFLRNFLAIGNIICGLLLAFVAIHPPSRLHNFDGRLYYGVCSLICFGFVVSILRVKVK